MESLVYHGLARFRFALRCFLSYSEAVTAEAGVTAQQYQALLAIRTHGGNGMMVRDLAEQLLLKHHGAVQLVDRMAQAGLVERAHSAADRRSVMLSLTPQGATTLARLAQLHLHELLKQAPLLGESLQLLTQLAPPETGALPPANADI